MTRKTKSQFYEGNQDNFFFFEGRKSQNRKENVWKTRLIL